VGGQEFLNFLSKSTAKGGARGLGLGQNAGKFGNNRK